MQQANEKLQGKLKSARSNFFIALLLFISMLVCILLIVFYFKGQSSNAFGEAPIPWWVTTGGMVGMCCLIAFLFIAPGSIRDWRNYSRAAKNGAAIAIELEITDKYIYVHSESDNAIRLTHFLVSKQGAWKLSDEVAEHYYRLVTGSSLMTSVVQLPEYREILSFEIIKNGPELSLDTETIIEKAVAEVNIISFSNRNFEYNKQFTTAPRNFYVITSEQVFKVNQQQFEQLTIGSVTRRFK